MELRARLATQEIRQRWVTDLIADKVDVEELKLALGLRIQHAARQGIDGNGAGWELMNNMVACKYEGQQGEELLAKDLDVLALRLPDAPSKGQTGSDALGSNAARALLGMGFLSGGL